jgi:amino acid adenylation domain-containing protein
MSIGRGVGLVTWVVDPENHEKLLPPGSIGELLVEGPAIGHGYFKDPKKTAEVFISDPHWLIKAGRRGRLYKTGDLVRYNEDGTLAYLGRKDSQVKIRGQRIELGDVEYWVRESMIEADQVVVEAVTPKGPGGRPTLAAFIKINNAEALFEQGDAAAAAKLIRIDAEVEKMLRRQLPSYMVPTIFIAMKSLPMTPTGKMNRRELRTIGGDISAEEVRSIQLANNGPKRQPVTDKEHQMQRVWSQVLGIEQRCIDLNASFFQMGGDSIAAMRVAGAARKLGIGITVAEIFQNHTLRLVAEKSRYTSNTKVSIRPFALVGNNSDASEVRRVISQACRVDPEMIEDAYPCTPLQEGLFSLASKRPGDYIMQAVLELSPKVDITMFRKAWESTILVAAVLRTRIVHDQKLDLVQVVLKEKPNWHETTGLEDYVQADRAVHMALSTPLSRLALVKNDKGHVQWFVLSMHHALYDGWSLSLILDMVRDAYSGADLEEAAFQPFINYVVQQVDDVKTSEYWQAELEGCEFAPYPALPTTISQPVSDTVVQHLVSRPKDSYLDVTPAILARAAWAIVTSRVTNAEDVVFGVTTSGRNAPVMNIDKMPAPAFATVPVRIQTSAGQRVSDYLEAVQQQAITMIPFEQLGLHRITKISADAQQACSFQTLLLVQQQATETFSDSDLGRWQNRDQQEFFNPYALIVEVNLLETGDLSLKAIFDSRIISRWMVERLLQQFDSVVQQIEKTRPRQMLSDISTMTEADLQQIWTWNQVVPGPAAETCLHRFIEQQAKAYPERIATYVKDAVHVGKGAGINTWVVDPTNANILLPPGSIGELLLEGPDVGLGYANHLESTTGSFIHDPTWLVRGLSGQAGRSGQLFKTGHLVQYDEHGNLDFLGHKDSQAKSRGLPYWQKQRGISSSFYAQAQGDECVQAAIPKRQPETPLERQLQQIWARVLDLDPGAIGLDDSFFHLGGDSVAAIKVASEARKADINITVAELFQHPTLGEAADQLASQSSEPAEKIAPFALLASGVDIKELTSELAIQMHASVDIIQDAYQCTPLQVGLLSLSFKRPGDYVMQATIELNPGCDISRFKQAWETTVQATPVLRTRIFHSRSAGLVQAVLNESICWNESSESLDAYLQQDRDSSMDIGKPLARYCMIYDGSEKPKYFVWTMHHALYDGWSMKLIMEAINRAFRGEQNTIEWPQFQQFIKHLQDQDDEALRRYWAESLEGFDSAPYPEVPKSITEQPVADSSVEHSFIHSQSNESGIMAATLVRAAWALVAGSASNSSDVVFGVTLSGRNAPISGIVNMPGPTITTVPVRIDTSSGQTVSSYLQKAQVQATTMISFEQFGLQRIAKVSSDAQRATQFQTLLVVQPAGDDDFKIDESMGRFCDNENQANWFNTQPLLIEVTLGKDNITASANFDSNVIPPWLVTRLLQRLEIVMQQLDSAGPGTTLDQIDSVELSEAERVRISGNTNQEPLPSFSEENSPKRQPVTEAERELHAIWCQVLLLDPSDIGVDDSLFQLGGDSISAMMITGEARKIGIKLSVSDIFRTPTIRDLATRMTGAPKGVSNAIINLSHSDPVELSFAQGRLWFLEQLYPGLTWYLMPFAIRFRGVLHLDALEKSLQIIESRHDTLRSTFLTRNNVHFQQVHPFVPKRLPVIDMPYANEKSLSEALMKDQTTTFNLTHEAGWRVTVYKLGEDHHVLSVVMHHINSDGWSVQVFRKELVQLYSAAIKGHQLATQIRPLPVQYRDYSAWQKQKLMNGEYQRQLDYWTDKLQTSRPVEFLTDKQRPKTLSGKAGEHEFSIEGKMLNQVQVLCKEYAVTPFVILLAAFRATHYRMTGAEDATMGTPNANRDRSELKDMIGFFVNMLCFRLTVEDDSFESLVRQVQQQTMESFDNQDIPFEQIVSKLNRERDLSRHPIVQVVFAYHTRGTLDTVGLEGLDSELLEPLPTTRFDLELHFFEEANELKGAFIYSTDLYTSATITNMLSVFMAVLEGALNEPRSKIATLSLLTADGYTELKSMGLLEIQRTNYPRDVSIVDVFQQQATAHPDKVAVKDSLSQITFATLNEKSDLVSQYLRTQGFSAETVIPVIAKRSVQTIIAFLGILKANMAYLPLDPNAPIERTKLVLSSIQGPTIILLGENIRSPKIQDMKSIFIQSALEHRVQSSFFQRLRMHTKPSASSLAYVLYTSGSTGKPKGVMVEHRSILRLVLQSNCSQYLTRNGAVAHMANTIFDASTLEIYGALLNGLTLVCLDHELVLDHIALQKSFSEERIGAAFFTPAHLKQILADSPMTLSQLDTLFVGGDRFDTEDCIQARGVVKGHIINGYGPTENTVFSTMYHVEEGDSWANGLPIGRAISNSGAYIMDSQLHLQPLGVVGELVVTGDGLARGYTESQLNTDRFVTVDIGGQQLKAYRTGDLARFRPADGLIEFFGRADAQVKIRGHRVELGEIEHVLLGHGSVTDAVALIYQGGGQQPQLYAFAAVPSPMVYERMEVDDTSDAKGGEEEKDEEAEHMQVWSGVFDGDKYMSIDDGQVLGRDFVGWTSMYDGALIDRGEMNEWLDDTIAAMNQNLGAGHVLELGTGSGMILFNLIQGLNSYIGLDPSDRAVEYVNKAAQSIPSLANKARVYKGTADQVAQLPGPITPNIVICNSVAQYFPSQEYLFNVIDELVQKEGIETLFFGDMRSQAMYSQFCVTQVLSRSGDNISKADLRQSIAHIARKEMEFLVDPGFFTGLQSRLPEYVEHVEILPKNMVATNELSCYRYAAVIHVKRRATGKRRVHDIQKHHWIDFAEQGLDRSALVQRLRDSSSQTLPVSNIPYNKTLHERLIVEHLAKFTNDASSDQDDWVSSLRVAAHQCSSFSAYELKEIAKQTGYQVEISWARQFSLHGGFDAVFHRIEPDQEGTRVLFQFPNDYEGRPVHTMTSQPLLQQARQRVREELEARLINHLPAYMIPKVITILDEMPVNANGKVDRKALVGTLRTRTAPVRGEVREPNTKTEETLQGIWARVLNISSDGIGLDDSFFQLGGDSITAMKVVNEARKLGIDLAVSDIFRSDNLEELALQALQHIGEADKDEEPVILVDEVTKSALLRELDASGTSIRSDQVTDILPLTSMQKRYVKDGYTNGLFVHYFFLDFSHDLDIERLKASLQQLLQSVPILRAAFLELQGKFWQVIPEVLDLPWAVQDVEESLPEALDDFCRADIKKVSFFEPTALFTLLRNRTEGLRLVIRLSHAQYDGASFPAIIKPLIDGYFGRPTTKGPDFSAFLAYIARRRPASIVYWKDLLQGSSLTTIQPHVSTGTQVLKPAHVSVESEVTLPALPSKFTTATLASAAWAILLAQTTGGKDIVYGHIVTGRNARICGPEEPVGACLNVVPVRATLSLSQTPRELLRLLQMQFSSMGDADSLGYEDIIENCTSWPAGTQFESLIHHANINEHPEFDFGEEKVKLEFFHTSELMLQHIMLMSYPVGNRLQFNMLANTSIMSVDVAQTLVNRLCTIVFKMGNALDEPIFKWLDELRSNV